MVCLLQREPSSHASSVCSAVATGKYHPGRWVRVSGPAAAIGTTGRAQQSRPLRATLPRRHGVLCLSAEHIPAGNDPPITVSGQERTRNGLQIPALELLVVVDDELPALDLDMAFADEGVDHARNGLARCPGHIGKVLLQR